MIHLVLDLKTYQSPLDIPDPGSKTAFDFSPLCVKL